MAGLQCSANRDTKGLSKLLARVVQSALLAYIGKVERISIGLVAEDRAMAHNDYMAACSQRLGEGSHLPSGVHALSALS